MFTPAKRTALRAEENRPAPPSEQVNANAVIGPTPYRRAVSTFAPVRWRAALISWRLCLQVLVQGGEHAQRGGDLQLPDPDSSAAVIAASPAWPCALRSRPSPHGRRAPWWNSTA